MALYSPIPTNIARTFQAGEVDVFGNKPEIAISDGDGAPCRHCLDDVPAGEGMLILAYKPFEGTHAYTEVGPIFLCARPCAPGGGPELPAILTTSADYLLKGYTTEDRILYGTGRVVAAAEIAQRVDTLFSDPRVAYIHVRSARNNCFQCRIDR